MVADLILEPGLLSPVCKLSPCRDGQVSSPLALDDLNTLCLAVTSSANTLSLPKTHLLCQVIHRGSPAQPCRRGQRTCAHMHTACSHPASLVLLTCSSPLPNPSNPCSSPHLMAYFLPFFLPMNTAVQSTDVSQGMSLSLLTPLAPSAPWESTLFPLYTGSLS